MTLINWKSKEIYIQEMVNKGQALDMRKEFANIQLLSKLQELEKVNERLTEELAKYNVAKQGIERLAQLTILLSESTRNQQMANNAKPPIEIDEVVNDIKGLTEEYDITYNQEDGKLYLAYNGLKSDGKTNSEVIIQGIALSAHPDKGKLEGLTIDRSRPKLTTKDALLSGIFYFENLPVDLMEKLPTVEETKTETKVEETKMSGKVEASLIAMTKVDKDGKIIESDRYGLRVGNVLPANLKAPQGLSRSERKEWWDALRKEYPDGFDKGGNYIGFVKEEETKVEAPTVKAKPKSQLGLLTETGAGNGIYSIIDARVDDRTCFIGRFFQQKNAFAIISTPTAIGDEHSSAMLFFEKDRTANFVLKGLLKSPTWEHKLEGCEVYKASQLSETIRKDRNRSIYYITNAVTALIALGTQKKQSEVEDAVYEEVKD